MLQHSIHPLWTAMLEIVDPQARSMLLRDGFGDALGPGIALEELEARMERLAERAVSVPRKRQIGQLRLDLVLRDAFVAGRAINLHPREFALLWRLAEVPGLPVRPDDLLCDVWRLSFRPETNTLAVHVSRLRAKLRLAGLDGIIETLPDGAYRIFVDLLPGASLPGGGMRSPNLALDAFLRLGKEQTTEPDNVKEQEHDHAA